MLNDKQGVKFSGLSRKNLHYALLIVLIIAGITVVWFGSIQIRRPFQATPDIKAAKDPVESNEVRTVGDPCDLIGIDMENGYIEVTGYQVMTESACLTIHLEGVPAFRLFPGLENESDSGEMTKKLDDRLKQIYLVDQEGQEYRYEGGNFAAEHLYISGCANQVTWSSNLMLEIPILSEHAEILTLVVPLSEEAELRKDFPRALLEGAGECRLNSGTISW
ncbi:MAG: hypothetical protein ACQES4_12830 [Bacillota bacterium]